MVMEKIKKYIMWAGWPLFLLLLWFNGCARDGGETDVVTIPAKHGSFPAVQNPVPLPAPKKEYSYQVPGNTDTITVTVENPVNDFLLSYYQKASQPQKDSLCLDALGEREYIITREDDYICTDNYIKAQGKVLNFQQDYTIKPQKVAVPSKEVTFRMLAGLEVGNTAAFDNFSAKANVMFQNKKGDIFSTAFDTEQRIWVGYARSIFNVKK